MFPPEYTVPMRLDDATLDALYAAAAAGGAHPVDILRLVDEVRWYKDNCVPYHLPTSTPQPTADVPTVVEDNS